MLAIGRADLPLRRGVDGRTLLHEEEADSPGRAARRLGRVRTDSPSVHAGSGRPWPARIRRPLAAGSALALLTPVALAQPDARGAAVLLA
ncbi:hypothetical protein BU198_00640, partial [Streptomyces sp. CBMA156]|nr:hypothetical protein [Streptomyces sp. CBMA156]